MKSSPQDNDELRVGSVLHTISDKTSPSSKVSLRFCPQCGSYKQIENNTDICRACLIRCGFIIEHPNKDGGSEDEFDDDDEISDPVQPQEPAQCDHVFSAPDGGLMACMMCGVETTVPDTTAATATGDTTLSVPSGITSISANLPSKKGKPHVGTLVFKPLSMIESKPVEYLWAGRLPLGKLSVVFGRKGNGKSFMTQALAALVSSGSSMPGDPEDRVREPGDVLILSFEDGRGDTIRPRIERLGGDLDRIHILETTLNDNSEATFKAEHLELVAQYITTRPNLRLVVIDPLMSVLGGVKSKEDELVREALACLVTAAELSGAVVLIVAHSRKRGRRKITDALEELAGSVGIGNLPRSVLHVGRNPNYQDQRIINQVACNVVGNVPAFACRIVPNEEDPKLADFTWEDEIEIDVLDVMNGFDESDADKMSELEKAKQFIVSILPEGTEMQAKEVHSRSKALHISPPTLGRACRELGIKTGPKPGVKSGPHWWTRSAA